MIDFAYPSEIDITINIKKLGSPKYIKSKYPDFYNYLINKYKFNDKASITELMWLFFHNLDKRPECPVCGNDLKFRNWTKGYSIYCSQPCMSRGTRSKANETQIKKYGGVGMAAKNIKEKILTSITKKYGGIGFASTETNSKIKNTMMEKYGVINPMECKEFIEKIEDTMMEKYGVKRALQNKDFLQKSQQTCMKHYGVKFPSQSKNIMKKVINTQVERYGGFGGASPNIKNKVKKTNLKKYGREWGFDYDKIVKTNLERYGDENPLTARCSRGEIIYKGYSKLSQQCFKEFDKYLSDKYNTQYAEKGGEKLIITNNRKYYVDYFIEELNTAVEFNGDVWHGNPDKYSANDNCFPMNENITARDLWDLDEIRKNNLNDVGVKVIIMWESEYKNCKDIKSWLQNKLGINL